MDTFLQIAASAAYLSALIPIGILLAQWLEYCEETRP